MFNRRNRSASATARPRGQGPPAAAGPAQAAAAQAFLASRPSSVNLSASAAAAALRSMTPTPTPVSQIQTKRMLQRQLSNSSAGGGRPGLQRQGSSGSMTERTFRSPSPNHLGSSPSSVRHPPVPAVPYRYSSPPPLATKPDRRAFSMEPPPRVMSPTMRSPAGRVASPPPKAISGPQRPTSPRGPSLSNINELERSDSRGSTNFSYPLNARPNSPTPRSSALYQSKWAPEQSPQSGTSAAQAERVRQEMVEASQQPVKKKKKKVAPGAVEGSHLASGTVSGRPIVTPYQEPVAIAGQPIEDRDYQQTPIKKKKKATAPLDSPQNLVRSVSPRYSSDSDSTPDSSREKQRPIRASGILNKQPSIVREDSEGEREANDNVFGSPYGSPQAAAEDKKSFAPKVSRKLDDASPSQYSSQPQAKLPSNRLSQSGDTPEHSQRQLSVKHDPKGHLDVTNSTSQGTRQSSISPSRSTRFSANLSSDLATERKHEPLPRSVSPAKSALKHNAPSPRGVSPADGPIPGAWKRSSQTPSEASDNTSMASADGTTSVPKKKKSVRVSFDEAAEIVGTAAPPAVIESPSSSNSQYKDSGKKSWFGLGKAKGSSLGTIPADEDLEEVFKPRPELPSFGSIRGNKSRPIDSTESRTSSGNQGLRGSANSSEPTSSSPMPSSSNTSSSSNDHTLDTSVSSDQAIGHILSQEHSKSALLSGNRNKSSNLPLPPQVTSVEGSGYTSEENDSEDDTDTQPTPIAPKSIPQAPLIEKTTSKPVPQAQLVEKSAPNPVSYISSTEKTTPNPLLQVSPIEKTAPKQAVSQSPPKFSESSIVPSTAAVPTISVHPATPGLDHEEGDEFAVKLPGVFPPSTDLLESTEKMETKAPSPGLGITNEQSPKLPAAHHATTHSPGSFSPTLGQRKEDASDNESSAGDSVYSDAEEDLSYMEGGFGSINAIVDSPIVHQAVTVSDSSPDSPTARKGTTGPQTVSDTKPESWEKAQAHWSDVAHRQRQGPDPTEVVPIQKPKTKKKKFDPPISSEEIIPEVAASLKSTPPQNSGKVNTETPTGPKALKKSMKQGPENDHFRHSMRENSGRNFQSDPSRQFVQPIVPPVKPRGALQKKHIPPAKNLTPSMAAATAAGMSSRQPKAAAGGLAQSKYANAPPTKQFLAEQNRTLQRTLSNGSDSSSSFQRRRRAHNSADYSMRRSMRTGAQVQEDIPQTGPASQSALRRGIRSLSPISRRPFSPVPNQNVLRTSMRTSYEASTPTMRNFDGHQRSSSAFGGFGKSKTKQSTSPPARPFASKMKSRFVDSDDEDAPVPTTFRSRYEDSSDDEPEPVKFRPVRGIPKKDNEEDSTDLEDSSDIEKGAKKKKKPSNLPPLGTNGILTTENGAVRPDGAPLSPTSEKKRGFFSRFRSKKPKDDSETLNSPIESPTQQGSHFNRVKSPEPGQQATVTPMKNGRQAPQRIASDSWPLTPKLTADDDRPFTSDGIPNPPAVGYHMAATQPRVQARQEIPSTVDGEVVGRKGKKKRFPMLRRAFGLYD